VGHRVDLEAVAKREVFALSGNETPFFQPVTSEGKHDTPPPPPTIQLHDLRCGLDPRFTEYSAVCQYPDRDYCLEITVTHLSTHVSRV
jgi:hypothetical protein